jgi:hypothetical protein
MIYFLYALVLVPINLIGTILTFPLAFLLVIFKEDKEGWNYNGTVWGVGPRLFSFLSWFQTPDNSLNGDHAWEDKHSHSWWSRVQWLWRNPFYGFAVKYLHGTDGMSWSGDLNCNEQNPGHLLVKGQGLFQYVLFKHIFGKCLYLNLGWNIRALVDPAYINDPTNAAFIADYPATFAFSPRLVDY